MSPSIAEGVLDIYDGYDEMITVTTDAVGGEIWTWFLNGGAVSVGSTSSFNVAGASYVSGMSYYLSGVAYQADGAKAGSVQYQLIKTDVSPDIVGTLNTSGWAGKNFFVALYTSADVQVEVFGPFPSAGIVPYAFLDYVTGDYKLLAWCDITANGSYDPGPPASTLDDVGHWWGTSGADRENPALATVITAPVPSGTTFDWSASFTW